VEERHRKRRDGGTREEVRGDVKWKEREMGTRDEEEVGEGQRVDEVKVEKRRRRRRDKGGGDTEGEVRQTRRRNEGEERPD
jgi:hypothetical protein